MSGMNKIFDRLSDDFFMNALGRYGRVMMSIENTAPGRALIESMHHAAGRASAALVKAAKLDEGAPATEIGREFVEKFFSEITSVVSEKDGEFEFTFESCPYGFSGADQSELCRAAMNFEEQFIENLGGSLVIEERIPDGAPKCRFRVVNR
jgi:hypothetical protein